DYKVMASYGHIRDLPEKDIGVELTDGRVHPRYQLNDKGRDVVARLKAAADKSEEVILATDPDREGEAIAWHLKEALGARRYARATFNAITRTAVLEAIAHPRAIDQRLVDAQQARRILDRIVGYVVSPTCSRGTGRKDARSAGRVQSVALRIVAEREREIVNFKPETYFIPVATVIAGGKKPAFKAFLVEWKGEPLGRRLKVAPMAEKVVEWCRRQPWRIVRAEKHRQQSNPPPPFITSTLQQAASVRLQVSPQECMKLAQSLYEDGRITYMRTDSTAVDAEAAAMARAHIAKTFPPEYLPAKAPTHASAGANAQEAHEAIRPIALDDGPDALGTDDRGKLYRLIWERFVASQMSAGIDQMAVVDVAVAPDAFVHETRGRVHTGIFRARGKTVIFDGWRRLTEDAAHDAKNPSAHDEDDVDQVKLPDLKGDEAVELKELGVKDKTTKAPPRYTEASLIKVLEKKGVGRPSTYAAIMGTIVTRGYVAIRKRKLHASDLGMVLTDFLIRRYAGNFIHADFTNRVEASLDRVARGELAWEPFLCAAAADVVALARQAGLWYDPFQPRAAP
nr:type I DNA topoisomerase [Planctomycetota bacterium]